MLLRFKIGLVFIISLSFLSTDIKITNAVWWDPNSLPVPPDSREEKRETRNIGGATLDFIYYTSTMDAEPIKDFYRKKLILQDWQEKNIMQDINQIQVPNLDRESMEKVFDYNLLFEKGEETLILNFMPENFSQDGKTRFTISVGKLKKNIENPESFAIPELVAKPKKDVAPVYPQAALINLSEKAKSLAATYFTKDNIEPVIAFYKSKMSDYGWELVNESPLKKMDTGSCPSCAQNSLPAFASDISTESWVTEMDYTNARGDSCKIGLSEVITAGKENFKPINITTITVDYYEKID